MLNSQKFNITPIILSFILGLLLGVLGVVSLRHEIWPLTSHVGVMVFYIICGLPILIILFFWYFKMLQFNEKSVGSKGAMLINKNITFMLVTIIIFISLIMGMFFVLVE